VVKKERNMTKDSLNSSLFISHGSIGVVVSCGVSSSAPPSPSLAVQNVERAQDREEKS
jgi:hypothetical protein